MKDITHLSNIMVREDEDHILWLSLDKQDSHTNTLTIEILEELLQCIQMASARKPKALVIQSGKKNGFIAGADVYQFQGLESPELITRLIMLGQRVFAELAALPFPTVAWISGFCLGGGLELVLACRYRIAIDHPQTRLGLPEVLLGIHPGWGGTVLLPRLIGVFPAMELMLTGRGVSAKKAAQLGLVDICVPKRHALTAVLHYANRTQPKAYTVQQSFKQISQKIIDTSFVRGLVGKLFYKKLAKKVNPLHYPAPYAMVDNWVEQGIRTEAAFKVEADSVIQLAMTESAKNLVRTFYLREQLKTLGREVDYNPTHVHVVGAGAMGGSIAAWCALKGFHVTLQDPNVQAIASTLKRAQDLFSKHLKEPFLIQKAMDRLLPVQGAEISRSVARSDIIIEAIIEQLEAKQALFKHLESIVKPGAILATNTSTILLKDIASALKHPEELLGMHFFNPVFRMQLVEVISCTGTDPVRIKQAMCFVRALDKLPLPVQSSPGFLVNRVLMPYLIEAMHLLEEGVSKWTIDQAAIDFGMPMGPFELMDTIGLDVCLLAGESLKTYFGGEVPFVLRQKVERRDLGKKSGKGFYEYKHGKIIKKVPESQDTQDLEDITHRLVDKIIQESLACLEAGVVSDADILDAGMIFGAGFPPFRGGPMHYYSAMK